jgi:hypothetical protein
MYALAIFGWFRPAPEGVGLFWQSLAGMAWFGRLWLALVDSGLLWQALSVLCSYDRLRHALADWQTLTASGMLC